MCPIASEDNVEVTFGSYKERQAHYAQMKRPGHFFWIALSPCRKAWMPSHEYINFEHIFDLIRLLYGSLFGYCLEHQAIGGER